MHDPRPGWPLWYELTRPLRISLCLLRGGHRHDQPLAPAVCSRCPGTAYDQSLGAVLAPLHPRRLYWSRINRYRDRIRPWALAHPRRAAWFNIYACPGCGDLYPPRYKDDCDTCAFLAISHAGLRSLGAAIRRRRRTPRAPETRDA